MDSPKPQPWADSVRAVAILSIVVIHVVGSMLLQFGKISSDHWWIANILDSCCRAGVPLFLLMSGALLYGRDESLAVFLKKRCLRILPPFVFWSLIYLLFTFFVINDGHGFSMAWLADQVLNGTAYHLRYVYILCGIYLLFPVINRWLRTAPDQEILFFLCIWFVTLVLNLTGLTDRFGAVELRYFSGYLGYTVLGYYLIHRLPTVHISPFLLSAGIALLVALIAVGTAVFTGLKQAFDDHFYNYLSPQVALLATLMLLLVKQLAHTRFFSNRVIRLLSTFSFGIYCSHLLVLWIFREVKITVSTFHPLVMIPLLVLGALSLSLIGLLVMRRIRLLRFITG